jgi:hypothetical protein
MIARDPEAVRSRSAPREVARAHVPVGLLLVGALLFAAVATLAVTLLRAH